MTYRMLDSIYAANLPAGADAYLAYPDGDWPTLAAVRAKFPSARILSLAVFASDDAEGLDIENGDATVPEVYDWFLRQLARKVWRPVLYISASLSRSLLDTMTANGFSRSSWRLLTAHYDAGEHICGPSTCGYPQADGTQWTDSAPGVDGSFIDESLLDDAFFPPQPPPPAIQEDDVAMLDTGTDAQTVIITPAGTKGLLFGNDCTLLGLDAPVLRIAQHSSDGKWHVAAPVTLTASGSDTFTFTASGVDFVSVSRASGGPADGAAVGYSLT